MARAFAQDATPRRKNRLLRPVCPVCGILVLATSKVAWEGETPVKVTPAYWLEEHIRWHGGTKSYLSPSDTSIRRKR